MFILIFGNIYIDICVRRHRSRKKVKRILYRETGQSVKTGSFGDDGLNIFSQMSWLSLLRAVMQRLARRSLVDWKSRMRKGLCWIIIGGGDTINLRLTNNCRRGCENVGLKIRTSSEACHVCVVLTGSVHMGDVDSLRVESNISCH
eukprot:g10507.t1